MTRPQHLSLGVALLLGCLPYAERAPELEDDEPACGNIVLDPGEECDPGIASEVDCTPQCTIARCGDGIVSPGETCDDGNVRGGDGCSPQCRRQWETLWTAYETLEEKGVLFPTSLAVTKDDEIIVAARTFLSTESQSPDGGVFIGTRLYRYSADGERLAASVIDDVVTFAVGVGPDGTVHALGSDGQREIAMRLDEGLEPTSVTEGDPDHFVDTVRVAADGSVVSCGHLRPATGGAADFHVASWSSDGAPQWAQRHDTTPSGSDKCTGVAVGPDFVYAVGTEEPDYPDAGLVVRRYSRDGDLEWTQRYVKWEGQDVGAHAVAVDAEGNVAVAGFYRPPPGADANAYVGLFAPNGAPWWQQGWTPFPETYASARAVDFDATGRLLVMGHVRLGRPGPSDYVHAAFVNEYDIAGTTRGNHLYIESRTDSLELIDGAVDSTGAVLLLLDLRDDPVGRFLGVIKLAR